MSSLSDNAAVSNVDLSNCEREPIHQLGSVQPFGFLLAVSSDWIVRKVSLNAGNWLKHSATEIIGMNLDNVLTENAVHAIRNRLQALRGDDSVERVFCQRLLDSEHCFDLALYPSGDLIVIEIEPSVSEPELNSASLVRSMVTRLHSADSFVTFCREAARQIRTLSGFDRVMIYRFNQDNSGEVIAETVRGGVESFLGLRYPASDIPAQARAIYLRNWLRIISDVGADPISIASAPDRPEALDLSLSGIRSVSPIHIEYLKNMAVGASLSISIVVRGRLWGLIACHHLQPRYVSFERRVAMELIGQMFSLLLEGREREEDAAQETRARAVQDSIMAAIAAGGASLKNFSTLAGELRSAIRCDGIGIRINGESLLGGLTPTKEEFIGLSRFLNGKQLVGAYATHKLSDEYKPAADFQERAAGLLAIPTSRSSGDYIIFFRSELARTIAWAGNPQKPAEMGPNGVRLTPRKSFDAWNEVVRGESEAWSEVDKRIAESLRVSLLEVVLRLTHEAESDRRISHERQELLIAELNHRVRNILGLVKGLLAQTSTTVSTEDFANIVSGRVEALARAHEQITTDDWKAAPLKALIRAEAEAYVMGKNDRVRITGDEVLVAPQAFSTLALVIHELMTNSAKYGALNDSNGWIDIKWQQDTDERLIMLWQEHGGPPVRPPTRRGFGSTIIERSIPFDLKGEAHVEYALTGVKARFVIPGHFVEITNNTHPESNSVSIDQAKPLQFNGSMLLAEDNLIIAMDAEDVLHDIGIEQVTVVSSVQDGLRYLESVSPQAALLDFNLGAENSIPLAEKLAEMKIPFFFATGYGDSLKLPSHFATRPVVKKPYNAETLRIALAACLQEK